MGKRVLTIEEVKKRTFDAHGDIVTLDESSYVDMNTKCIFIHKKYGAWPALPRSVTRGGTHMKASHDDKRHNIERVKAKIKKVHGDLVVLDENSYIDSETKCVFINKKYNISFSATPCSVLQGQRGNKETQLKDAIISIEDINSTLLLVHKGLVTMDVSTFSKTHEKCTFIDTEYGNWGAYPTNVLRGHGHPKRGRKRATETILSKYGVEHVTQNKDIALRAAKTGNHTYLRLHWKTGEELICKASYEPKVVDYLNTNKIDYLWQPQVFRTPILTSKGNISTYRPDLFLVNENKWIEIKGWMRPESKSKWDWFKTQFPTAELWDRKKLKEMGLL